MVLILLSVVVIVIPPLVSIVISASSVIVVPPAMVGIISPALVGVVLPPLVIVFALVVVAALLVVSLIRAVIKVMSGCHSVIFLLELWAFISIMTIISTDLAYSLWNQLLALLWWGRLSLLLIQLHLL